jgi:hypothetical protein
LIPIISNNSRFTDSKFSVTPSTSHLKVIGNSLQRYTITKSETEYPAYLCGILGQWDILLLNLTSIGFMNFFRCQQSKMKHLKIICEADAGPTDFHWFHKFFRCFIIEFFFFYKC